MDGFLGDILSDLVAATIGGRPRQRTSIAGRDLANSVSQVLTAAMLLEHAGPAAGPSACLARSTGRSPRERSA